MPSGDQAQDHCPFSGGRSLFANRAGQGSNLPRHLRRCTFCTTNAVGEERHCVINWPHFEYFEGLWQQHAEMSHESCLMPCRLSCGTRTRSIHVLLYWPLLFLIGLCWLYGRSAFPPPPGVVGMIEVLAF